MRCSSQDMCSQTRGNHIICSVKPQPKCLEHTHSHGNLNRMRHGKIKNLKEETCSPLLDFLSPLTTVAAGQGQLKTTADIQQRIAALQPRCPTISILDTARPATGHQELRKCSHFFKSRGQARQKGSTLRTL